MPASQTLQNAGLDWFRGLDSNIMIALLTAAPANDSVAWAALPRATYTGYADLTELATTLNAASGGTMVNNAIYSFAQNTGAASASLTHFAVRSGTTGENYRWGTLDTARVIGTGETGEFAAGALTLDDI